MTWRSAHSSLLFLASLLLTSVAATGSAHAERRVALVIGNSAYANVSELTNPKNDAKDVAERLNKMNFEVILGTDLTRAGMKEAFEKFAKEVKPGDVGVFFYAGHGISLAGENFLIPTDMPAEIQVQSEEESKTALDGHLINISEVLTPLQSARLGIVFLDACRNTPSKEELGLQIVASDGATRKVRALSFMRGITKLPTTSTSGASGIFRAYATQPNNVSDDGAGRNSPFTKALLKHLDTPGLDIHQMMRKIRLDVQSDTNGRQIPWEESALTDAYYFIPPGATTPGASPVTGTPPTAGLPPSGGTGKGKTAFPSTMPKAKASAPQRSAAARSGGGARRSGGPPPGLGAGVGAGL